MSSFIGKNNDIHLTRGDTLKVQVDIIKDGEPYTPAAGDVIRFALKHAAMTPGQKQFADRNPLITKTIDNETLMLEINPADTNQMDFGSYVYDIQITFEDGTVDTFIPESDFKLMPEVD